MKITDNTKKVNAGCDFILHIDENRKVKLLQITDMQLIDSLQRRTPERLRQDEINAWNSETFDGVFGNHLKSLVAQTNPDLIFITGDMVYGSFDDNGTSLEWFCDFMDSFRIPWAPIFGNHDNESKKGIDWQCERLRNSKYCLFNRGNVSGNGNYTVGISVNNELVRVLYMIDTNGCLIPPGIYPNQIELIKNKAQLIKEESGKNVPGFLAVHIPTEEFEKAENNKGYKTEERELYTIGVDAPAQDGDFGFKMQKMKRTLKFDGNFVGILKECYIDGVFAGHYHNICTVIGYEGIKWVFGLKTGQCDHHVPGQLGGTLVTCDGESFEINHIPALVKFAPFPQNAPMFKDFFCE